MTTDCPYFEENAPTSVQKLRCMLYKTCPTTCKHKEIHIENTWHCPTNCNLSGDGCRPILPPLLKEQFNLDTQIGKVIDQIRDCKQPQPVQCTGHENDACLPGCPHRPRHSPVKLCAHESCIGEKCVPVPASKNSKMGKLLYKLNFLDLQMTALLAKIQEAQL